jgi:hypothetical protein
MNQVGITTDGHPVVSGVFPLFGAETTSSAGPVVGQWTDVARRPKLLPDRQFAFPDGVWARRPNQKPTVNVAGPTSPRHRNKAVVHVLRLRDGPP